MGKWETRIYEIGKRNVEFSANPIWIKGWVQSLVFAVGWSREVLDGEAYLYLRLGLIDLDVHIWKVERE